MFDTTFWMRTIDLKDRIVAREVTDRDSVIDAFESSLSPRPHVFNIETTNCCNMKCRMCPRTSLMTRPLTHMDESVFSRIVDEIQPHSEEELRSFREFVAGRIGVHPDEKSEDAFYFSVCSRCVVLHGYGEPLLDPRIADRVRCLTEKGIPTYFSCNPSNIREAQIRRLFESGVGYIKFSLDSISDEGQKEIRGSNADFTEAYEKILKVLDMKREGKFATTIVLTMIQLSREQEDEMARFLDIWRDKDVYAYIKSQDNKWYFRHEQEERSRSHYEKQYCEFPWTSLTVMADGTVVPCTQDYDTEMKMGNVRDGSLAEIWRSERYREFRAMHVRGDFAPHIKCRGRCDQKLICDYLR